MAYNEYFKYNKKEKKNHFYDTKILRDELSHVCENTVNSIDYGARERVNYSYGDGTPNNIHPVTNKDADRETWSILMIVTEETTSPSNPNK